MWLIPLQLAPIPNQIPLDSRPERFFRSCAYLRKKTPDRFHMSSGECFAYGKRKEEGYASKFRKKAVLKLQVREFPSAAQME